MVDVENNDNKVCADCQEQKPLDDFHRSKRHSKGRHPYCKECRKVHKKKEYEKSKDERKQWRDENKDVVSQRNKSYYWKNRDKELARNKEWRENNDRAEYNRDYLENNRDKVYSHVYRRRARKLQIPNEPISRQAVFERDRGICGICLEPVDPNNWHMDHIIPLARPDLNPTHTYDNVRVAHPRCNLQKGSRLVRVV